MIVLIGVAAFIVAALLSYAQATQGRTVASYAVGAQLLGIIVFLLLGERYYQPLGLFIAGTLLGSFAAFTKRRLLS